MHRRTEHFWRLVVEAGRRVLQDAELVDGSPLVELDVISFALFAYHLGDYVVEFEQFSRREVDDCIRGSCELAICRDLATARKHARMASKPWSQLGKDPIIRQRAAGSVGVFVLGESLLGDPTGALWVTSEFSPEKFDAAALVRGALRSWRAFGFEHGPL